MLTSIHAPEGLPVDRKKNIYQRVFSYGDISTIIEFATMANTYTQIHVHAIAAVKYRNAIIQPTWNESLHQYITGVVQNNGHKMIQINSMPDHLHLFFGFRPAQSLSDLMRLVKCDSSEWLNKQKLTPSKFQWQEGFGVFSYSKSQVKAVADYIEYQQIHHQKKTFLEEYIEFLDSFEIDYDNRYLFKPLE